MDQQERMSEYSQKRHRGTALRLIRYFGINPKMTALSLFLALLVNAALIVQPLVLAVIIDDYLNIGNYELKIFIFWGAAYFALSLLSNGAEYTQAQTLRYLGQQILHKIRTDLFSHIQTMSMRFFDNNSSGRILTRVINDVEALADLYTDIFITIIRESVLVLGMLAAMFMLDARLALWCMGSVPVVALLTFVYRLLARRNFIKIKSLLSRINGFLAEHIIGMRIVQIFNMEQKKFDDFEGMNKRYYRLGLMEITLHGLSAPVITLVSNLMIALLIFLFADNVLDNTLKLGVLYAFTDYVRQLFHPISMLAEQLTTAQSALISADRVFDIMDNKEDVEDLKAGRELAGFKGSVEFQNVWFAYSEENWVLKDVSFKIEPGSSAAFIGATGCGKTTVMSLISRFYTIQKGRILIDGMDSSEINLHSLRRNIAVVMQDVFLFNGDIRYNIRLNNTNIKNKDIEEAAKAANCHDMILSFPGGYMHGVAERGSDFSLGQRQLISFARAVAAKPRLLILDEATASIDSDTERALQSGLDAYAAGKTLIVIAHRISTIVNSDIIFVMDKGEILERGNHDDLLAADGIYSKLYHMSLTS
jgi:ATP-binding cassette subfamily B protein